MHFIWVSMYLAGKFNASFWRRESRIKRSSESRKGRRAKEYLHFPVIFFKKPWVLARQLTKKVIRTTAFFQNEARFKTLRLKRSFICTSTKSVENRKNKSHYCGCRKNWILRKRISRDWYSNRWLVVSILLFIPFRQNIGNFYNRWSGLIQGKNYTRKKLNGSSSSQIFTILKPITSASFLFSPSMFYWNHVILLCVLPQSSWQLNTEMAAS